jgi:hypothetical protein
MPTVKFVGDGIRIWGVCHRMDLGPLEILHGNVNAEGYKDILTRCVLSAVEEHFSDDNCLYQHDNAPCQKARSVREWFVDNKVPEMDWSVKSPDLNPIEHLWDELEHRLSSRPQRPILLTALATAVLEEWATIPPETFTHLVKSLPSRVRAVAKTKVRPTLYKSSRLGSVSQGKSD